VHDLPSSIDTPFYQNAGNHTGREISPVPPVYQPRKVAAAIANAIENGREYVFVPRIVAAIPIARAVWPRLTLRVARFVIDRFQIGFRTSSHTAGNLYIPKWSVPNTTGGWKQRRRRRTWPILAATAVAIASGMTFRQVGRQRASSAAIHNCIS
jgi:hypothetical protein